MEEENWKEEIIAQVGEIGANLSWEGEEREKKGDEKKELEEGEDWELKEWRTSKNGDLRGRQREGEEEEEEELENERDSKEGWKRRAGLA